jgi:putative membrane protein
VAADASWTFDPGALLLIGVLTAAYVPRWRRVRIHNGPNAAPVSRLLAFTGGVLVLAAALISPIDRLGEQAFVMHMVQHILLLDLAPILLIVSLTKVMLRPATRRLQRLERAAGPLAHPFAAVALYIAVMWAWHVPALYDAALEHSALHAFEHTCFMVAGFLYWWHLLSPIRSRLRLGGMGPVVYMLSTKVLVGLLGIALTFAPDALYAFYKDQPPIWGLDPGTDQALAGAVMALEQSIVMGIALAWLFVNALIESEREEQRAEREEERAERARAEDGPRAMPEAGDGGQPIVSTTPDGRNG